MKVQPYTLDQVLIEAGNEMGIPVVVVEDIWGSYVQRNYNEKAELGRTIPGFDDKKELFDYETLMFVPTSNPRTIGVSSKDKFGTEKYSEYYVGVQEK